MIITTPAAPVTLLLIRGVTAYSRSITERSKVQTQQSQIDVAPKQRFGLIPNLVETIKGYTIHEKEALRAVTDTRSRYPSAEGAQGQMKVSIELSSVMNHPMTVVEYYPKLKTSQNSLHSQRQTSAMEEKLANYR